MDFTNAAFTPVSTASTSIPVGASEFCQRFPADCLPNTNIVPAAALTEASWNQLLSVNAYFNANIVPVTDRELYGVDEFWTYPNGYGDCEDIALAKRRQLIQDGWSPSDLMIAVVRQRNGEGHAVLTVRTDRGDFVLDNMRNKVMLWSETEYTYLKRQSAADPGRWVKIQDGRNTTAVGSVSQ